MATRPGSKTRSQIWVFERGQRRTRPDHLATEEPLEIRLRAGKQRRTLAVTMRTPGADFDLAAGFLYSEGVITQPEDIYRMTYCVDSLEDEAQRYNILNVELRQEQLPDLAQLDRHFYTSSACGVCGKASIDALRLRDCASLPSGPVVPADIIYQCPTICGTTKDSLPRLGACMLPGYSPLMESCSHCARISGDTMRWTSSLAGRCCKNMYP